jgi:hypothetical protein
MKSPSFQDILPLVRGQKEGLLVTDEVTMAVGLGVINVFLRNEDKVNPLQNKLFIVSHKNHDDDNHNHNNVINPL